MIFTQNTTYFSIISIIIGASLPLVIPLLHFGIVSRLWDQYNFPVDKYNCRNTCWDTIFKGTQSCFRKNIRFVKILNFNCFTQINQINVFQVRLKQDQNMDQHTSIYISTVTLLLINFGLSLLQQLLSCMKQQNTSFLQYQKVENMFK